MHTCNQRYTGGKPAEQYQRAGRLLDGSPYRLQTCLVLSTTPLHGVLDTTRHVSCMYDLENISPLNANLGTDPVSQQRVRTSGILKSNLKQFIAYPSAVTQNSDIF